MGRSGTKKKSGVEKTPSPVESPPVGVAEVNGDDTTSGNATPTHDSAVSSLGQSPESVLSNGVATSFKISPPEAVNQSTSPQDLAVVDRGSPGLVRGKGSPISMPPSPSSPGRADLESNHSTSLKSSSFLSFTSSSSTPPPSSSQVLSTPVKSVGVPSNSSPLSSASDNELLSRNSSPQANPPTKSFPPNPLTESSRSDSPVSLRRSNSERSPSRKSALSTQAVLLSDLIDSPRFYHPHEGQELSGCQFLYKDIMRSMVQSTVDLFHSRPFWNQLFISTVTVDRSNLGWNEMTSSLYIR